MKRFSVKSLMRFRSVAKSWKSLIDSSRFVSDYNLGQTQPHIFILYKLPGYLGMRYVSIVDDDSFPNNMVDLSAILKDSAKQSKRLTLVGSSQGLLCLYRDSDAIIWNPWIRKSVTVNFLDSDYRKYERVVCFGVCPKTSDPKLVHLPRKLLENETWKVEVDDDNRSRVIISFDLTNEEFGVIYVPDSLARYRILELSKYRESLVLFPDDYNGYVCDVWMMEGNVKKSFKKLFTIKSLDHNSMMAMGISYNGEAVLKIIDL
ncbi:putative F-box protein At1g47730 [Rutidosis leptorrhynchoides]|uniref:putative F-box protein At1g47730 n=1 Tax=Rutidosis leptorrhynchoides TaxID=125765 RepID=UPI003A98EB84